MRNRIIFAFALSALIAAGGAGAAYAHEDREIAGVNVEIGFETEPPIEGLPNGIVVVFTKAAQSHGQEDGEATEHLSEIDVDEHGGIFGSGTIAAGGTFEFVATADLENLVIPFHNHLNHDATGEIRVMAEAPEADRVPVEIHGDRFEPSTVMVRPGAAIVFANTEDTAQTVVSGLAPDAAAHSNSVPVTGLERTLRMEITHAESGTTRGLTLEPVFGRDGAYKGALIPTATGRYSVRLFGTIEGAEVDETFVSGPGTFDDVAPAASLQFPNEIASAREIESAARGARDAAAEAVEAAGSADSSAATALTVGVIGVVIGALGLGVGGFALASARKRE